MAAQFDGLGAPLGWDSTSSSPRRCSACRRSRDWCVDTLALRHLTFIEAARSIGSVRCGDHLAPHLSRDDLGRRRVFFVRIRTSIITVARLSFLGPGARPPNARVGCDAQFSTRRHNGRPARPLLPAIALFVTVLAFTPLGMACATRWMRTSSGAEKRRSYQRSRPRLSTRKLERGGETRSRVTLRPSCKALYLHVGPVFDRMRRVGYVYNEAHAIGRALVFAFRLSYIAEPAHPGRTKSTRLREQQASAQGSSGRSLRWSMHYRAYELPCW